MKTAFLGTGHHLPSKLVTNADLAKLMDTSDEWIQQRTGIRQRYYVDFDTDPMGSAELGARAGRAALEDAGVSKDEIDCVIYGTLSPDRQFPGDAVSIQATLDIPAGVPCIDLRNQCSAFLYGLQIADSFIRSGVYRKILLIGAEVHSTGLEFTDRGRDVAVIFGDAGAAAVLGAVPDDDPRGVLSVNIHADGRHVSELHCSYPSSAEMPRLSAERLKDGVQYPRMNGKNVFKHAVVRMPEAIQEALHAAGKTTAELSVLIPHQANLRISEMVQKRLELRDDQVFNNIQDHGNTTAASIPMALDQARKAGRVKSGDLVGFAAFGAGFTWGAALVQF